MGDSGPSDSQVGDDPSTFDDEGVGYGNVDTTTQQFQEDTRQENQRSNILDDPNYDAQFTADRIENQFGEGTAKNFMTPDTYAQTTQAARDSGLPSVSIDIPSITATSSNIAPGVFQDQRTLDMLADTTGATAPISKVETETLVNRDPTIVEQLKNLTTNLGQLRESYNNPIFQAAVEKADREQTEKSDLEKIQEALDAGTEAENLDRPIGSIVGDDFGPALDMVDAQTTATGTNLPEDYEENVGRAFPVETLERAERLVNEKTALENLGLPSFLTAVDPGRISRDLMATSLIAGRPIGAVEGIRGVQAPNIGMGPTKATDKETIEEYNKRTGARIPESQIITDNSGLVVGIKDAQGNLITGMDPNAREEQGDGGEQVRRAPPKAPTDPCPDGYQLIDGKCTPTGAMDTGTGFMMFPADRDPPFKRGPFTPTTVATNPNIRALNPVTFGLSNIFRR